jgi:hypothetical protein
MALSTTIPFRLGFPTEVHMKDAERNAGRYMEQRTTNRALGYPRNIVQTKPCRFPVDSTDPVNRMLNTEDAQEPDRDR